MKNIIKTTLIIFNLLLFTAYNTFSQSAQVPLQPIQVLEHTQLSELEQSQNDIFYLSGITIDKERNEPNGMMLTAMDEEGNKLWEKEIKGNKIYPSISTTLNDNDDLVVAIAYEGTIHFSNFYVESEGGSDILLFSLNDKGKTNWIKPIGGMRNDLVGDLESDKAGNIYFLGQYSGRLNIEGHTLNAFDTPNNYLLTLSEKGLVNDLTSVEFSGDGMIYDVEIDNQEEILLSGIVLEKMTINDQTWKKRDVKDIVLVSMKSNGTVNWSKQFYTTAGTQSLEIDVNANGETILAGSFLNKVTIEERELVSVNGEDLLLSMFDNQGNLIWVKSGKGGDGDDRILDVSFSESGDIYAFAKITTSIVFDEQTLTTRGKNYSIVKLNPEGKIETMKPLYQEPEWESNDALVPYNDGGVAFSIFKDDSSENQTQLMQLQL